LIGSPLRIIVVNDTAHINGGASRVALSSALALANRGHQVSLYSAVGPVDIPAGSSLEVICLAQEDILSDPNRLRASLRGLWNFPAAKGLQLLLADCDPARTVVHIHGWAKALSSSIIRAIADSGLSAVCTLHDYFLACPNGGFFNYPEQRHCKLKAMSIACLMSCCDSRSYRHKFWRYIRQLVQRHKAHVPNSIKDYIVVSDFSKLILEPYLPTAGHIHRLSNPVDDCQLTPVNVRSNDLFMMVGRISPEKGAELFAEACSICHVKGLVIGDGPLKSKLESSAADIKVTGWVAANQVIALLRRARALIFPSLCYETQGLVVLEAAALGIPAVVADETAARDLIIDGENGLLFRQGDAADLADKILRLSNNPALSARLGAGAYQRFWADSPTVEAHASHLETLYTRMLTERL
jgi:glycosyltransferase involved in cell wall biosynthesis